MSASTHQPYVALETHHIRSYHKTSHHITSCSNTAPQLPSISSRSRAGKALFCLIVCFNTPDVHAYWQDDMACFPCARDQLSAMNESCRAFEWHGSLCTKHSHRYIHRLISWYRSTCAHVGLRSCLPKRPHSLSDSACGWAPSSRAC